MKLIYAVSATRAYTRLLKRLAPKQAQVEPSNEIAVPATGPISRALPDFATEERQALMRILHTRLFVNGNSSPIREPQLSGETFVSASRVLAGL
jgi:hypothetical protein